MLAVGAAFTWAAPTANALSGVPDLAAAVQDVASGNATPAEQEAYQAYVDWEERSYGVADSSLTFQTVEQQDGTSVAWADDPVIQNLEAAYNAAPAGGSIEAATGADLLGAAEDIGAAGSAEGGIATVLGGICASTVGCGLVGAGIAATIVVGPKIMSYYFPSANQALANDASSGTCPSGTSGNLSNGCGLDVPSQAKRIWCATVTQGVSDVYGTYGGGAWTGLNAFAHDGGGNGCLTAADYSSLGLPDMTSIPNVGGGMDFNDTGTTPCPSYSLCVPTADISHGGIWLLAMHWPSGWSWGSSAYATAGDTSQCSPQTWNGYAQTWTTPPPGSPGATSGWDRVDLAADDGNNQGCYEVNGKYAPTSSITWDYGWSVMKPEHDHVGFPRTGSCPSGQTCPSVPPPSTMPTVTPPEVSTSVREHSTVVQFFDGANGTTNPATGNSNMPGTVSVPSPSTGETWSQYQTDLANAGFTNVQRQILTSDTADLDQPASAVTLVNPAPGQYADTATTITVTTNPDSPNMPQATARETNLASILESQNSTVTDSNKLDIARSCLELEDAATQNTDTSGDSADVSFNNCKGMPIFVSGNDVREAADHDLAAVGWISDPNNTNQAVDPGWVNLNYRPAADNPGQRMSTTGDPPCNLSPSPSGDACDEYPFYATQQGGSLATPLPNLKYINSAQNSLQGSNYAGFLSTCKITDGQPFLSIPLPAGLNINSMPICNP